MARRFEQHVAERLAEELGEAESKPYTAAYTIALRKLTKEIYGNIQGIQQGLSDHSDRHIDNVLHNVRELLTDNHEVHKCSAMDLYCLCMFILFHDVGNLFGRKNHHKRIGEVYDWVRGTGAELRRERTLIIQAAMAHTGEASDGSHDTLKELNLRDHLDGHPVALRKLAAVLRFADELAEGPQRTSDFMRARHAYPEESQLFHDYASITNIHIDRADRRIRATYEIEITGDAGEPEEGRFDAIRQLLEFTYHRIVKLDQERRYARYYNDALAPFTMTSVEINFYERGRILPVALDPLRLDDKVVPGDPARTIEDISPAYEVDALLDRVRAASKEVRES